MLEGGIVEDFGRFTNFVSKLGAIPYYYDADRKCFEKSKRKWVLCSFYFRVLVTLSQCAYIFFRLVQVQRSSRVSKFNSTIFHVLVYTLLLQILLLH